MRCRVSITGVCCRVSITGVYCPSLVCVVEFPSLVCVVEFPSLVCTVHHWCALYSSFLSVVGLRTNLNLPNIYSSQLSRFQGQGLFTVSSAVCAVCLLYRVCVDLLLCGLRLCWTLVLVQVMSTLQLPLVSHDLIPLPLLLPLPHTLSFPSLPVGVLSFFALQGGAKKVYAVEASNMATYCAKLVKANNLSDRMQVLGGKIEEVSIDDVIMTS